VLNLIKERVGIAITVLWVNKKIKSREEKSKLKRREPAISYAIKRVRGTLTDFVLRTNPPRDWQERLEKKESNWNDFYEKVWNVKETTLSSLDNIIDRHSHLIDDDLQNDVIEMIDSLENYILWVKAHPDYVDKREAFDLHDLASIVTNVSLQAANTIKSHNLLNYYKEKVTTSKTGELPRSQRVKPTDLDARARCGKSKSKPRSSWRTKEFLWNRRGIWSPIAPSQ
jgi:hypothetical protein